jgi:hypothetical protein
MFQQGGIDSIGDRLALAEDPISGSLAYLCDSVGLLRSRESIPQFVPARIRHHVDYLFDIVTSFENCRTLIAICVRFHAPFLNGNAMVADPAKG